MLRLASAAAGIIALIIGCIYVLSGMTKVDPGYVALQIRMLGPDRGTITTLPLGWRWVEPFSNDVVQYDIREQQQPELKAMQAGTMDGQPILVDISLQTGLDASKVAQLHVNVGKDYYETIVFPAMRAIIRTSTGGVLSDHIYTEAGRQQVQNEVEKQLNGRFNQYGIRFAVNLRDIRFANEAFIHLLEAKAGAAQKIEIATRDAAAAAQTAVQVANKAEGEKQRVIREAQGEREKAKLEGEGIRLRKEEEAKGILAIAQAEAEGLRLRNAALGSGANVVAMEWARNLGPNVKVLGYPLGAPGTTGLFNVDGILGDALKIKPQP